MLFKLFVILASPLPFSRTHSAPTSCSRIFFIGLQETPTSFGARALVIWIWIFLIIPYPLSSVVVVPGFCWPEFKR